MANEFLRSFDDLLDAILVDYANLDESPDTTEGSITYVKAACLASMLWGLYKYQDYISRQIFPDTADSENLIHHGAIYGLTKQPTETDQDYLGRILQRIRKPPAGGNQYDWGAWTKYDQNDNPIYATGISGTTGIWVEDATVIPNAQGPGTVDVVLMPNDITYLGTTGMQDLVNLATASVDVQRPVTASTYRVLATTRRAGAVSISVQALTSTTVLDTDTMEADIQALFDDLKPGDPVYRSQLAAVCINDGAINATVVAPSIDLIASNYELLYPSSISISQV